MVRCKCIKCGHEWEYKGMHSASPDHYVTCPACHDKKKVRQLEESYLNSQNKEQLILPSVETLEEKELSKTMEELENDRREEETSKDL